VLGRGQRNLVPWLGSSARRAVLQH
jgi:hypothetical protein